MVQSRIDFEITRIENSEQAENVLKLRKFDQEIKLNLEDLEELHDFFDENPDIFYIKGKRSNTHD